MKLWHKLLMGGILLGWLLSPGVAVGFNFGIISAQLIIQNPLVMFLQLWSAFSPASIREQNITRELEALDRRNYSPWPKDSVRQYKAKV